MANLRPSALAASYQRFVRSGFVRHIVTLATGAALAQIVPLLAQPILTRLYTPHAFGVLSLYVALMSNLAVLATARYELAIVLPAEERRASNLMALSMCFATALAVLVLVAQLLGVNHWLLKLMGDAGSEHDIALWLYLLPLSLWLAGMMQAWTNWNNRHSRYRANASGRMSQSLGMSVTQLAGGMLHAGPGGLILGQFAGQVSSLLAQAREDFKRRFAWRHEVDRASMKQVACDYSEFPKVNTPHAFVTALQDSLTLSLLGALSGTATVGFYGMMMRLLKLPAALIGQAVAQVAYRELAEARNAGRPLRPIIKRMAFALGGMALVPFLVIQLAGEPLFGLVLGQTWRTAGRYAEAMSPFILFHFIASPLAMVPLVIERQRTAFLLSLVQTALFVGALWSGFHLWDDPVRAFRLVSWVMVGYFIFYFTWLYHAANK
ncbi:lipopolysaccharide biosynthesis protein [Paludibacterium purpuratum]|uniref:lipopolysaccharide biosynthesis protein n=1 Tax=Paludibacterium purpuratum TaxID=1144873 RepID=UPI001AAD84BF|nr:oligosaccharide flippase family protein [Paludibacterium purpuratum]